VKRFTIAVVLAVIAVAAWPAAASAQSPADGPQAGGRLGRRGGRGAAPEQAAAPPAAETVTPQQIQTLFDGMVLSRAQVALQLTDQQFAVFIPKLLSYQKLQQRHRQQRQAALAELRRLTGPNAPDGIEDALIAEKAKSLDDLELQALQDQQRAMSDLDSVLGPRQRARFRVFLESMEREKISLLVRAQQGRNAGPPPQVK
jgi:hypothetical protein